MNLLRPPRLAPCAAFLLLAACQGASPFKNMTVVPLGSGQEALCPIYDKDRNAPRDSLWFRDDEGNLCPMHFQCEFANFQFVLPSPDGKRFALMSYCEGCFELAVFQVSDCLGWKNGKQEDAKPLCSLCEHRYSPEGVYWHNDHELRFSAEWTFPAPPDDQADDSPPLRHWKWNIDSDKIEEVK